MAETESLDYWGRPQPNDIQVKWNERRATMLINYYGRTYEYQFATKALTEVSANLNGFLPPIVPLMSQQMLYMHENQWINWIL